MNPRPARRDLASPDAAAGRRGDGLGSAVWHSENAPRMQRVLAAWASHTPCQNLPAILAARLRQAGIQPLRQTAIPILNRELV